MKTFCHAKIQNVIVTEANPNYEGSITIPLDLLQLCDIEPYEQVHVLNVTTGERIITYAIIGTDQTTFCINGAAARLFQPGDKIIIIAYKTSVALEREPKILIMGQDNKVKEVINV